MKIEHLAIDGAVVTIEADADLRLPVTAAGWAIVPSLMRAHPFTISPAGHSKVVERTVRSSFPSITLLSNETYSMKDGTLRVAEVRLPTATGRARELTVGAWEGKAGCLTTSLVGATRQPLVEMFDTLRFSEGQLGLAIDSPVITQTRAPEVIKEVPGLGLLNIRPAIASELERLPKARGYEVTHGEIFRFSATGNTLLFVGASAVVRVTPLSACTQEGMLSIAQGLRVEWTPRGAAC